MAFKFQGFDFLHLDASLTEEELLVRRTTREFVDANVIPIIEESFREGRFPRELVAPMGELGFYGASLEGYGCAGMSNVEYGLVMQELERGVCAALSACNRRWSCIRFSRLAPTSRKIPGCRRLPAAKSWAVLA
jgi:alkylation response protein AidB-like acyl-CoA dehydrogenase